MSKVFRPIHLLIILMFSVALSSGQDIEATIGLDFKTSWVSVEGKYLKDRPAADKLNLSFLRSIAGLDNLGNRITDLQLQDRSGKNVSFKKLVDGEYLADSEFNAWSYRVDLTPPKSPMATAHVSWLKDGAGILMLADLLPRTGRAGAPITGRVMFRSPRIFELTPPDPIYSSDPGTGKVFEVSDIENSVFYVGGSWDTGAYPTDPNPAWIFTSGTWNFSADDASDMVKEIYGALERRYGRIVGRPSVAIAKFPQQVGSGQWQAETRGRNVTIISSDMPFRTQSLQRLHEQLRHEMFHLWIPNGVNLTGNYDWFYEGFALYQSLKLAVALNRIRFEDFLDTLSRAHTIDTAQSQRTSLIQMSSSRFAGSNTQIYARGMLVAFLTDLAMLQQSKGKRSVDDLLKDLYVKHQKPADPVDGNAAVLALLKSNPNVVPIVEKYVTGTDKLDWTNDLAAAGIEDADAGPLTRLQVKENPGGRQKALLDKLGYNNWRKLSPKSK